MQTRTKNAKQKQMSKEQRTGWENEEEEE